MCKKESKRGKIKNERVQDDYLKKISNHIEVESIDEGMIFFFFLYLFKFNIKH